MTTGNEDDIIPFGDDSRAVALVSALIKNEWSTIWLVSLPCPSTIFANENNQDVWLAKPFITQLDLIYEDEDANALWLVLVNKRSVGCPNNGDI